MKVPPRYPKGWNAEKIAKLIEEQERLTEEEQVAADEAAIELEDQPTKAKPMS